MALSQSAVPGSSPGQRSFFFCPSPFLSPIPWPWLPPGHGANMEHVWESFQLRAYRLRIGREMHVVRHVRHTTYTWLQTEFAGHCSWQ
jgi:hypothetical protein